MNYIMSKKRILIVEDEALTVLALKHELAELGYEIAGDARTAADALRTAEDTRADLVLMLGFCQAILRPTAAFECPPMERNYSTTL